MRPERPTPGGKLGAPKARDPAAAPAPLTSARREKRLGDEERYRSKPAMDNASCMGSTNTRCAFAEPQGESTKYRYGCQ